jgi:hypothetical protein
MGVSRSVSHRVRFGTARRVLPRQRMAIPLHSRRDENLPGLQNYRRLMDTTGLVLRESATKVRLLG